MAKEKAPQELLQHAAYEQFKELIDLSELDDDLRREFRHQISGLFRGNATIREIGKGSLRYGIPYLNSPQDVVEFAKHGANKHQFDYQVIIFELISDRLREKLPESEADAIVQLEVTSSRVFNTRSEAQHATVERLKIIFDDTRNELLSAFINGAGNHISLQNAAADYDYEEIIKTHADLLGFLPIDTLTITLQKAWYDRNKMRQRSGKTPGRMYGQVVSIPILSLRLAELVSGQVVLEQGQAGGIYQQEFTPNTYAQLIPLNQVESIFQIVDFLATLGRTDILT